MPMDEILWRLLPRSVQIPRQNMQWVVKGLHDELGYVNWREDSRFEFHCLDLRFQLVPVRGPRLVGTRGKYRGPRRPKLVHLPFHDGISSRPALDTDPSANMVDRPPNLAHAVDHGEFPRLLGVLFIEGRESHRIALMTGNRAEVAGEDGAGFVEREAVRQVPGHDLPGQFFYGFVLRQATHEQSIFHIRRDDHSVVILSAKYTADAAQAHQHP
ncbi:hypothetical protein Mapa_007101 [Marchantia paleacea]|nr:hypothetical protein Mapa_007101 [Marchantia paleacea]